ncbi:unnamed protein product [Diplocarpon coronariae]|uniref:DUF4604 domain-containing protein n=1 Tax=Diplocarpon coronariae TaxID=2795749 RepID=A0A218ZHJ7_9HELO|nr:hypothetical protein B2J93_1995 [Marssonina coronariae]
MSKITSKNLHYDDSLPPFLARLRANNAGDGRHEYAVARPKRARTAEDEAEDEPVYFDEGSGETLTKSEWEAREAGAEDGEGEKPEGEEGKEGKEKIAAIGAGKKRKAGKVVGRDAADEPVSPNKVATEKPSSTPGRKKSEKGKIAKNAKKIKLSFGDDE